MDQFLTMNFDFTEAARFVNADSDSSNQQKSEGWKYLQNYGLIKATTFYDEMNEFVQRTSSLLKTLASISLLTDANCQGCIKDSKIKQNQFDIELYQRIFFSLETSVLPLLEWLHSEITTETTTNPVESEECLEKCDDMYAAYKIEYKKLFSEVDKEFETNAFLYASGELEKTEEAGFLPSYLNLNENSINETLKKMSEFSTQVSKLEYSFFSFIRHQYNCNPCISEEQLAIDSDEFGYLEREIYSNQEVVSRMYEGLNTIKDSLNELLSIPLISSLIEAAINDDFTNVGSIETISVFDDEWQEILYNKKSLNDSFETLFTNLKTTWMYCAKCIEDFKKRHEEYKQLLLVNKIVDYLNSYYLQSFP